MVDGRQVRSIHLELIQRVANPLPLLLVLGGLEPRLQAAFTKLDPFLEPLLELLRRVAEERANLAVQAEEANPEDLAELPAQTPAEALAEEEELKEQALEE